MEGGDMKLHAVALPYPGQGHINPLMQLCRRLACLGFTVSFVCIRNNYRSILQAWESRGINPSTLGLDIRLLEIRDDMLPERSMDRIWDFVMATQKLEEPFVELIQQLQLRADPPITCIISDAMLSWTVGVARRFNLKSVLYWPLPASALICSASITQLLEKQWIPAKAAKNDAVVRLPGLPELHPTDLPMLVTEENPHDPQYTGAVASAQTYKQADYMFANTCEFLEGEEIRVLQQELGFRNLLPVGPLQPLKFLGLEDEEDIGSTASLWKEEDSCLKWLDAQNIRSVLYVSFGSISSLSAAELEIVLQGLLASNEKFLWVLRQSLVRGMSEETWKMIMQRVNEGGNGMIVHWAPQLQVLRHTSIAAFLTHCGWNSTFESISAGLPMLCWPCFAEQSLNSKYIVDVWKIGLPLKNKKKNTGSDDVANMVKKVMSEEGEMLRKRVKVLSDASKKSARDNSNLLKLSKALRHCIQ